MQKGMIVIIEGTSCVGKTTLCNSLKEKGWNVIPEAIRYLEKETQKIGDEASPIPDSQEEEEYYQDQLFKIELQKLVEANELANQGKNVVLDKSAIATVATAKAFEEVKGFSGTFKRAYNKYFDMIRNLQSIGFRECDMFLLLISDYDTICKRNVTRGHVLEDFWIDEKIIKAQREVLEKFTNSLVGKFSDNKPKKEILDTTNLSKLEVLKKFNGLVLDINRNDSGR